MARPFEERVLKSASMKGGALLWIEHHTRVGERVPGQTFLEAFTSAFRSDHFGQDLLDELVRTQLVAISPDDHLVTTVNAEDWMREASFWQEIIGAIETGSATPSAPAR
jgi:hypothetical protein